MCGIAGIYSKTGKPIPEGHLEHMLERIRHRGPDDEGQVRLDRLHLGMVRLSVIDLQGGHQPMVTEDDRYTIVFNGEIYNYPQLRDGLKHKYPLRTQSDTETLLYQIVDRGAGHFMDNVTGMYAFAIWDAEKEVLLLGRDRFGEKPLFYWETADFLYFASEIKSLLVAAGATPDPQAVWDFLTLGYVPGEQTAFHNIHKVPPAHLMTVKGERSTLAPYWNPSFDPDPSMSRREAIALIRECFVNSVTERLIADVPVGIFLSAGIDSNAVLSVFHKEYRRGTIHSYTAQFGHESYDESGAVKAVTKRLGIENTIVPCRFEDLTTRLDEIVYHCDNLLANPAILPNFLLAERAHQDLKVILHGGAGDELFFGYPTYVADYILSRLPFLRLTAPLLKSALGSVPAPMERLSWHYKLAKFADGANLPLEQAHYFWRTIFTEDAKREMLRDTEGRDTYHSYRRFLEADRDVDFFTRAAYSDLMVWWADMGNYQADAVSMSKSLEIRLPFLDHKLVELVHRIPRRHLFKGIAKKRLFKQAVADLLPREILGLPKAGFHVPLAHWFAEDRGRRWLQDRLSAKRIADAGLCNPDAVARVLQSHWSRKRDASFQIFNLVVLHTWHRTFCG